MKPDPCIGQPKGWLPKALLISVGRSQDQTGPDQKGR